MPRKIRVLSIGHSYVVALNRAILREVARDPMFEVTVAAPAVFNGSLRSISIEPEPPGSPLRVVPLPAYLTAKMHIFFYDPSALRTLFKDSYDCAHFWEEPYIFSGFQLGRAAHSKKIPYLFRTAQSLIKNYIFPFGWFEKSSLTMASQWVAGGHLVYQAMQAKGWTLPGQVITLAVDTKKFKPMDIESKKRGQNQLKLQGPLIGYLGRLAEEKGLDLLMEVLSDLKQESWSLLAMGSGPYQEKLQAWAEREGLQDRVLVRLLTHEEVPQFLPLCDLLVCPSQTRTFWKEQFGRMIVEGFAAGVPVMGSDSGEIPRVIADAGCVLPEADPEAWREELKKFMRAPDHYDKYRALGLQRAQIYSAEAIAEQYKPVYCQLAEGL